MINMVQNAKDQAAALAMAAYQAAVADGTLPEAEVKDVYKRQSLYRRWQIYASRYAP